MDNLKIFDLNNNTFLHVLAQNLDSNLEFTDILSLIK